MSSSQSLTSGGEAKNANMVTPVSLMIVTLRSWPSLQACAVAATATGETAAAADGVVAPLPPNVNRASATTPKRITTNFCIVTPKLLGNQYDIEPRNPIIAIARGRILKVPGSPRHPRYGRRTSMNPPLELSICFKGLVKFLQVDYVLILASSATTIHFPQQRKSGSRRRHCVPPTFPPP